jgi:excisionase family DNA binding protein
MKIVDYFYTAQQATKVLGINRITIWRWMKSGKITFQQVGREVLIPKWEIDLIKTKRKV